MSLRLESFQSLPRGADGWGSRLLRFGDTFTAVQGPKGMGRTPIMKGVIQGFGHEVELPPDVLARCESAETTITIDGRAIRLTRRLGDDFHITVQDGGEARTYTSQAEYARWFIALFSADPPALTSKQNQEVMLYPTVQIKDLKASDRDLSRDLESAGREIERLEAAIAAKRAEREHAVTRGALSERVLPKASELWVHASLDQRQRLQQLFFPEGVPFDEKRFSRTAVNAAAFSYLRPIQQGDEDLVAQIFTSWNPLTSWIRQIGRFQKAA